MEDVNKNLSGQHEVKKESAFASGTEYKTPMQKYFEPIRHFLINYVLNSTIAIIVVTEATHGILKTQFDRMKISARNAAVSVGLHKGFGNFFVDVMTVMIPGHLLAPLIGWMHNNEAKITRWLDKKHDQWKKITPDEQEVARREDSYAKIAAKPKQTVIGTFIDRVIGMLANIFIQMGLDTWANNTYGKRPGNQSPELDQTYVSEGFLRGRIENTPALDASGRPIMVPHSAKDILRIPQTWTENFLRNRGVNVDHGTRNPVTARVVGYIGNVSLELTSCAYTAIGTWLSGKIRRHFGIGETKLAVSVTEEKPADGMAQNSATSDNAQTERASGKAEPKKHAEKFKANATHVAAAQHVASSPAGVVF